jgi:hypothetical protein
MRSRKINRILFVWLFLSGLLGSLIGVPFTIAVLMDPAAGGPIDPVLAWLSALVEAIFFLAPASALGLWLGEKVGLGPILLQQLITKDPNRWEAIRSKILVSFGFGFLLGAAGLIQLTIPIDALGAGLDNPTTFEITLRALSAGLTEEILFRLGLVTVFVWIIRTIVKNPAIKGPSLWIANLLSALLFAAGHLPHMLTFGTPGWELVISVIAFNTISGGIMGWVYIRHGLISAVLAHFIADFVAHVVPRLLDII